MNRSEIIEMAKFLTERKQETVFNWQLMFSHVIQEFCSESRFWWRKRTFSFYTAASTPQYDLASITTSPVLTELSIEELTKLIYVKTATNLVELDPIFDDLSVAEAYEDTSQGSPGTYTFDLTDYKTLRIMPTPDGIYKVRAVAWIMPNPATDSSPDTVPLVPPWLHRGLVHGLEKYIWRDTYGLQDPRYLTAEAQYNKVLQQAQIKPRFTVNYNQQLITAENSIQST